MAENAADRFWDQSAPYGPNGYTYGRGAWVEGRAVQSIQFKMKEGDQCLARGVMLMGNGMVYIFTVLREGREHRPEVPRRLASRARESFTLAARRMLDSERDRIDSDLIVEYQKEVDAL